MQATVFTDLEVFDDTVRAFLEQYPLQNQILLANIDRGRKEGLRDGALMATVSGPEGLILAAMMSPPFRISLSHNDSDTAMAHAAAARLANVLADAEVSGVLGAQAPASAFSAAYTRARGVRVGGMKEMHLHELTRVVPPAPVRGQLRCALDEEYPLLLEWREGFLEGTGIFPPAGHTTQAVSTGLREGGIYVWEDGRPVSTATLTRPLKHGASISHVYTPPEFRKQGYASACVAALSQEILNRGYRYCSLYTEASNPTSNHIYREIGYKRIATVTQIDFAAP